MFSVSAPGKNYKTKETKNVLRERVKLSGLCLTIFLVWTLGIKQMMHVTIIFVMLFLADTRATSDTSEPELPVWRVTYEEPEVLPAPHFTTVHQLVQVKPDQTAVLECAVANVDTSVTVMENIYIVLLVVSWSAGLLATLDGHVSTVSGRLRVQLRPEAESGGGGGLGLVPVLEAPHQPGPAGGQRGLSVSDQHGAKAEP